MLSKYINLLFLLTKKQKTIRHKKKGNFNNRCLFLVTNSQPNLLRVSEFSFKRNAFLTVPHPLIRALRGAGFMILSLKPDLMSSGKVIFDYTPVLIKFDSTPETV